MSFLHDNPWLIQELLKIGQGKTLDPTENVSPQQAQGNLALKLLDQIQKEFSPVDPNKPAEVSTASGAEAKLTTQALENIGALVSFLVQNKITVNGKQPAYDTDPQQEGYTMYKLQGGSAVIPDPNRETPGTPYWINPELLSAYIVSLQAQDAQKPNRVLETYLKSLIQESNKMLGTKVNPKYQPPTQSSQQPGQAQQPGQGKPGQPGDQQGGQAATVSLADLAAMTPFNSNYIDFNEIMQFVSAYLQLAGSRIGQKSTSNLQQEAAQMQTSIGMAENVLATGGGTIQLSNLTPDSFKLLAKNANQAKLLANYLYTVIQFAGSIYQDFVTQFGRIVAGTNQPGLGPSALQAMQQQIAPGGPQQANMTILKRMMSML